MGYRNGIWTFRIRAEIHRIRKPNAIPQCKACRAYRHIQRNCGKLSRLKTMEIIFNMELKLLKTLITEIKFLVKFFKQNIVSPGHLYIHSRTLCFYTDSKTIA